MSAHRSRGAGRRRPRRPAQTGKTSGHRQVGRLVRRDAPAIGKQRAGVLKHHDAVAEQAPALFGMRRHHVGRPAIRCVRGRTPTLMLAHDAPRSVAGAEGRAFGADPPCRSGTAGVRAGLAGAPTGLTWGPNPAGGGLSPHCFAHTLLVPAAAVMLRPLATQRSPPPVESAAGQRDHQLRDDLPRGRAPPAAPATGPARRQLPPQARDPQDLGQQQRPGPGDDPRSVSGHDDLGTARGIPHGKVPSAGCGQDLRQALCSRLARSSHCASSTRPISGRSTWGISGGYKK